jgi:hypothetical protein
MLTKRIFSFNSLTGSYLQNRMITMQTLFESQSIAPNIDCSISHFKQIERFNDSVQWWFDYSFPIYQKFILGYIHQIKETKSSLIRTEIFVMIDCALDLAIRSAPKHPSLDIYVNLL